MGDYEEIFYISQNLLSLQEKETQLNSFYSFTQQTFVEYFHLLGTVLGAEVVVVKWQDPKFYGAYLLQYRETKHKEWVRREYQIVIRNLNNIVYTALWRTQW